MDETGQGYVSWMRALGTLAVLVHKYREAVDEKKRIWKSCIDLQMRDVNWLAGNLIDPPLIPESFLTCRKKVMTRDELVDLLKKIYE